MLDIRHEQSQLIQYSMHLSSIIHSSFAAVVNTRVDCLPASRQAAGGELPACMHAGRIACAVLPACRQAALLNTSIAAAKLLPPLLTTAAKLLWTAAAKLLPTSKKLALATAAKLLW